jgi:predicted ATP-grasp superfamily ATP-dependent carboligase
MSEAPVATVLVTDGEERAALAAVRSLGRAGHRVYVCAARDRALAAASRHCREAVTIPSALADPRGYQEAVGELLERWHVQVLLPISEQSLRALLPARFDRLGVQVPFPTPEVFAGVSDKGELLRRCARFGLAAPAQHVLAAPTDLAAVEGQLGFPVVIKPTRSVVTTREGGIKTGVTYASDAAELRRRLGALPADVYPILLQERIVGPGSGVFLLVWDGELIASFAHRRLREKPPAGGVSVYSESVAADPQLVEQGQRLLTDFGWRGVAMLEFKTDSRTGRPYLMEINGRLWGSLQLAIDAGVDFPALLVACALGERPAPPSYRIGARNRWWWGDVDHMLTRLRHSPAELGLPPGAPSRLQVVRDFLRVPRPGDRQEVLRWSDPWPFVRETVDWLRRV